jgi:hypothetical protein
LRLLSTHHILREIAPDTFALTRVASLLDSGKSVADVFAKYVIDFYSVPLPLPQIYICQ